MADDQFTAELESLCRIRRERRDIMRLIREVRKVLIEQCSIQEERQVRVWKSQAIAKMYDDLERVSSVFDCSLGRYLEGPIIAQKPPQHVLPDGREVKMTKVHGVLVAEPEDRRPIKGPGRRFGVNGTGNRRSYDA